MNKRVLSLLLACVSLPMMACGKQTKQADYLTPDDVEPGYYTSEEELPENAYYIMHKAKDDKGKPYWNLCQAMYSHFKLNGVAPAIFYNIYKYVFINKILTKICANIYQNFSKRHIVSNR